MIQGMIGKKIAMTQIFADDGEVIPVTEIKAGPCIVVRREAAAGKNGSKVQLGFVEEKKVKRVTKSMQGHFAKAKVPPVRILREFFTDSDQLQVGDTLKADIFQENEIVDVVGTTKGKGFQGVVRRCGFAGGRSSHGSMFHRRIGSAGSNTYPGRVIKGKGMPGRMGGDRRTVRRLKVVKVDAGSDTILVKGAIPGYAGNYVLILKNSFKRR